MVKVEVTENMFRVTGHAGSGEGVHDLMCNSVSVLAQALEIGISDRFLEVVKKESGHLEYKFYEPTNPAQKLYVIGNLKMIIDTLKLLAEENPEYVEVIQC